MYSFTVLFELCMVVYILWHQQYSSFSPSLKVVEGESCVFALLVTS